MVFKRASIFGIVFSCLLTSVEPTPVFYGNPAETCPASFRVYAIGDYLYWQASEANLEYAMKQHPSVATVSELSYPFRDGFRVGGGVVFPSYDWQVEAIGTRFSHNLYDRRSQFIDGAPSLVGLWVRPQTLGLVSWGRGNFNWDLDFNTVDFDLLRLGFTTKNCTLSPRMGLKRAWIDQTIHIRYEQSSLQPNDYYDVRMHNNFRGLGIHLGFDTRFLAKWGLAVSASTATALLYGPFHLHRIDVSSLSSDQGVNLSEQIRRFKPMLQGILALEWAYCFSPQSCRVLLSVGYEGQVWFGQNQLRQFVSQALPPSNLKANGTLTLQGLTLHARFDF